MFPHETPRFVPQVATVGEPWRFETVAGDRAVRGSVCQETEPCGGWAVRGLWNRGQHYLFAVERDLDYLLHWCS